MSEPHNQVSAGERKALLSVHRLRWSSRFAVLVACCLILAVASESVWPVVVSALSPFVALASVFVAWDFEWFHLTGIVLLLVVAWRHRWFCRWICPTGFCADQATWCGRRCGRARGYWPAIGRWIALVTLVGACVGYPLLLWLDPLALLGASANAWADGQGTAGWWYALGIGTVLLLSLVWPNVWCAKLCPLGGLQDGAHELVSAARSAFRKPRERASDVAPAPRVVHRRTMLGVIVGLVWATVTLRMRAKASGPLRPPGAVREAQFTGLCIRCGNCSRACPTDIIHPDWGASGIAGVLTPRIEFRNDYCLETCNQCTLVCPSGALRPVELDDKISTRLGVPVVDMDVCLLGDDRECSLCRNRCPFEAIRLEFCEEFYTLTPRIDLDRCPGCGACQVACPTTPNKAIVVRREGAV